MKYDLTTIGNGSVGATVGCYAARAGLKVLMIDAHMPPCQQGSHHGDIRLIRHAYGEDEKYVPLVLCAQVLWDELSTHSEEPIFARSGVTNFGPAESTFLAAAVQSAKQWQLNAEQLDVAAIMARWPEIRVPNNYIGLFEAESDFLHSELAIRIWIRLAEEAGCVQLSKCSVSAIHRGDDGITIETVDSDYHAKKAVISAGTWVQALAPELPIQSVRRVFAWYQVDGCYSAKNNLPAFAGEPPNGDRYYGFPAESDEPKIGKHNGRQAIHPAEERKSFTAVASDGSEAFPFPRIVLPGVGCCLYGASCTYDNSPDEDLITDTLPEYDNTLIIAGLSGHGFKFVFILGKIAADLVQDKPSDFDLISSRLSRFK